MANSMKTLFRFLILLIIPATAFSATSNVVPDSVRVKVVRAIRSTESITIDGVLSEHVWQTGGVVAGFVQQEPNEGAPATVKTEVVVAFDDEAIYIGAKMYDPDPDSIVAQLGRRDANITTDLFGVFLDTYNDKRSGFYFGITPAGTLLDGTLYNDDWSDGSWDGVWEGKARIDADGWTAEIKIPYSQLRFTNDSVQVWGINFRRDISRRNEMDFLAYTPKNGTGFVSRFPELVGIQNIDPPQRIEILPYVNTRAEYSHPDVGDPFHHSTNYTPAAGADLNVGIGRNLTLNATLNPDFGQVEVDPAVVNLSDVETFFQEKRPFFVEGANIFDFGDGGVRQNWTFNWPTVDFFYSRRIGRPPERDLSSYDYYDEPLGTNIIGAAKLTGKIGDNWTIGTLHAVTQREMAQVDSSSQKSAIEAEPLTYYGLARLQKEFNDGRQAIGFIGSATERGFADPALKDQINNGAFTGGVDGWTSFDDAKEWVLNGWLGGSVIEGTQQRLINLQEDPRHYFQRPDASYLGVDSTATSLTGYAGHFRFVKQKGNFLLNNSFGLLSPKFELNDIGFLSRTDVINWHSAAAYQWTQQTAYYHQIFTMAAIFGNWDFGGYRTWFGYLHHTEYELPNFYWIIYTLVYNPQTVNDRRTRGGPLTLNQPGYEADLTLQSNDHSEWVYYLNEYSYWTATDKSWSVAPEVDWKPRANLLVSVAPQFERDITFAQWVGEFYDPTATATYMNRYVFAALNQKTLSASIRVNWTFTPELSLEIYVQPLISSGNYHDYKELARPLTYDFPQYPAKDVSLEDGNYVIDPDGNGPAQPYSFSDPDFNFKSLRGNAVLRWEYLPGSVLYFVWTQSRTDDYSYDGDFQFNHALNRLLTAQADNIFMVKFSYYMDM
jgi:Domain of unknown function (DUF5916)